MPDARLRRRLLIVALGFIAVAVVAVVALFAGVSGAGVASSRGEGATTDAFRGSSPPEPFPAADFALRDAISGETVRMSDQGGRVVVLTFLESRCTAACPLIAAQVGEALRRLSAHERSGVVALAISVNPADDTARSVRTFLARHRAIGLIRYLNRPADELQRVWKAYQVLSATETGDADVHSAPVRIYSGEGRWLATLHAGADLTTDNLVHDIRQALDR